MRAFAVVEVAPLLESFSQLSTVVKSPQIKMLILQPPFAILKFDPAGYFVIMAMKGKPYPIVIEHYSNDGRLKNIIEGKDASTTCATLVDMQLVSQIDHAAYMGRERARVEICLLSDTQYVQDKTQGEIDCKTHLA
ncbi:MAG: DUF4346 domain-containing protein [Desulfobacterales bacterium]